MGPRSHPLWEWRRAAPVLGAVVEWLAFNAFVRQAGERQGHLSLMLRDGLERGGDELLPRG